jgi:predicted nucleotidyltransferase
MTGLKLAITLPEDAIRELCRRHGVEQLAIFGSVLTGDFRDDSDVDFLVRFRSGAERPWMAHFGELQEALEALLGRSVDLVDWKGIEQSENWIRRRSILESAQTLYAA